MNVETLLPWSDPVEIPAEGFIREATPDAGFWKLWKADKKALHAVGIRCFPSSAGWVVTWLSNVASLAQAATPVIPSEPAKLFVPEPLEERAWSAEQHSIFDWFRIGTGNLVVTARAGTGKTTTIKAAFSQAPEARMLYAVFNKKNQREAVEKITDPRVEVKTLHSLGFAYILRIWSGSKPDDSVERVRIESVCGRNVPDEVAMVLERLVGFAKNTLIAPTIDSLVALAEDRLLDCQNFEDAADGGWTVLKLAHKALDVINAARIRDPQRRISFNDMVWLPVAAGWVRPWFDLVCIDEAQDMNAPQLAMARSACKSGGRICVVGDDRQAIYGFRGAVQDGIAMMCSALNAAVLGLTTTYRCPKQVVALAAEFVPDYQAAPSAPEGIIEDCSEEKVIESAKIGDSILSRVNAPLMPLCLRLLRKGIPARIEGRDVGKMLLGIVKKLKAKSVPDFLSKVERYGDRMIARVSGRKNSEQRIERINDEVATLTALAEGAASVSEIESRTVELFQDSDSNPRPAVVLSSVHKAKGLEWEKVFILRSTFLRKGRESREEENIYYVAITRSKHTLVFITDPH